MSSIANMKMLQKKLAASSKPDDNTASFWHGAVPSCVRCNDVGVISVKYRGREEVVPCPEACTNSNKHLDWVRNKSYEAGRIPKRYQEFTFASFYNLPAEKMLGKYMALEAAREFCEDDEHTIRMHRVVDRLDEYFEAIPPTISALKDKPEVERSGLAIQGPLGIGKTALAAAAMNDVLKAGREVRMVRVYEAMLFLKETWRDGDEMERLQEYKKAPVLILDEFNLTDPDRVAPFFQVDWVTSILRYREGHDLPTLITCNIDQTQLAAQWGNQCADVVLSLCHWIVMGGAKLRDTTQDLGEAF